MGVAVAATEQIDQRRVGQTVDLPLLGLGRDIVWLTAISDDEAIANFEDAGRSDQSGADIAEIIKIIAGTNIETRRWRRNSDCSVCLCVSD